MRVFVTGASGWIGSAVVPELLDAGHEVVGLARSREAAAALHDKGVEVHRGDLDDLESLRKGADAADGVVHLAFKHDFSDYAGAGRTERSVLETLCETLAGSGRPLLFASGVAGIRPGHVVTENDSHSMRGPDAPRGGGEELAFGYTREVSAPLPCGSPTPCTESGTTDSSLRSSTRLKRPGCPGTWATAPTDGLLCMFGMPRG